MRFKNRITGEHIDLPVFEKSGRSFYLCGRRLHDYDRLAWRKDLRSSLLTISQSDEKISEGYKYISSVMDLMRQKFVRAGELFYYVAVLEIQPQRYKKYGVLAPHWHAAVGSPVVNAFPHAVKDKITGKIKKVNDGKIITWSWLYKNLKQKFGMYFIEDCWSDGIYDYLMKYLSKENVLMDKFREEERKKGRRVRIFSSSRIPYADQMSPVQVQEYNLMLVDNPELADLYWRREGSAMVARAKRVELSEWGDSGRFSGSVRYEKVAVIKGEWVRDDDIVPEEIPF